MYKVVSLSDKQSSHWFDLGDFNLGNFFHIGFVFVIVLMGWSLLPNAVRHFKMYCAPPIVGIIRT